MCPALSESAGADNDSYMRGQTSAAVAPLPGMRSRTPRLIPSERSRWRWPTGYVNASRLQIDLDPILDVLAQRIAARLSDVIVQRQQSPWMRMDEAIEYTRVPAGTFRKLVAEGRVPSHGGRRKLFHRAELDAALGYLDPMLGGT